MIILINQSNNYYTAKLNNKQISLLKIFYEPFLNENKSEYEQFRANSNNITIVAYKSGKVVFQGKDVMNEVYTALQTIGIKKTEINSNIPKTKANSNNPKAAEYKNIRIGSDEVGTGDFFGPIIVVAVYINDETIDLLKSFNILDSKKQTDSNILETVPKILKIIENNYSVVTIGNTVYNEKYHANNYHMNHIKAEMHYNALELLTIKCNLKGEKAVIDEFASQENFNAYIKHLKLSPLLLDLKFLQKAESHVTAVALASMIARYEFLIHMDKLSQVVGKPLPLGSGANVLEFARDLYDHLGEEIFKSIAKLNFKTFGQLKEARQLSLF